jgi:hypothetical protein
MNCDDDDGIYVLSRGELKQIRELGRLFLDAIEDLIVATDQTCDHPLSSANEDLRDYAGRLAECRAKRDNAKYSSRLPSKDK